MEDEQIVDLYLRREESAIRHTAEKYGQRLRTLTFGILQDMQASEECENDTYLSAWNSIPPHAPKHYFYPFLARIARNLSLTRCRENRRLKRSAHMEVLSREMEQCIPAPDDLQCRLDELALRQAINGYLDTLSAEKRNIFLRRYWYLDSIEAIAQRHGISQSKVKTMLFRCRNGLRAYLEKEGYTL